MIITLGARGALLGADGAFDLIPAYTVQTKDTTGAGDAFIGSFATFLAEGAPEKEAISQACLYASLSTTKRRDPEVVSRQNGVRGAETRTKDLDSCGLRKRTGG